jgi:hypothetical protein
VGASNWKYGFLGNGPLFHQSDDVANMLMELHGTLLSLDKDSASNIFLLHPFFSTDPKFRVPL